MGKASVEIVQSTFWMTNSGIITTDDGSVVLVDPGVFPDELAAIAKRVGERPLLAAISTHEDWDHVLWSADFPADTPRLAHPETVRLLKEDRAGVLSTLATWESELGAVWEHDLVGRLRSVASAQLVLGDLRIQLIPTPGHTMGHASLWLEEAGVLFAGDMLSDLDIPMLAPMPGAAKDYLRSLATLEALLTTATMVIPGHGSPCDREGSLRRLQADRAYIEALITPSTNEGQKSPGLSALMSRDMRAHRAENVDAHRQNGHAIRM